MLTNAQLRKFSFAVKNSSTILLPEWYETLTSQKLAHRMMPRDVSTRWNSTYEMLEFAVKYQGAINTLAARHDLNLRKYELEPAEWKIAGELRDVLKVCDFLFISTTFLMIWTGLQGRDSLLFAWYPESCHSHTSHGPH